MPNTTTFTFAHTADKPIDIRVIQINGQPWFAAMDIRRALDLPISGGVSKHLHHLNEHEKRTVEIISPARFGGKGRSVVISESGLHKVIARSRQPEAAALLQWVTDEVLPVIGITPDHDQEIRGLDTNALSCDITQAALIVAKQIADCQALLLQAFQALVPRQQA
ncbi:BRO-N domain-containing protein [Brevundimonas pishanensis]|uniref:BRO-N domain-containing protein n=1 Tax=Brevundimonas pishanensis TaxID=2896315 RepID=UPI001FA7F344|nr:Bro-N domain-containing protein [Brevundimonas pishanensis]